MRVLWFGGFPLDLRFGGISLYIRENEWLVVPEASRPGVRKGGRSYEEVLL